MFGYLADAYWLDLGTPEKYLQAHFDLLDGKVHGITYEAPWIAPTASLDPGARLGRWVAVGPEARIAPDAVVEDSVVHPGAAVGEGARVLRTIVGPGAHVGAGSTVEDCVLGAGARVPDGLVLSGQRVKTDSEAAPA